MRTQRSRWGLAALLASVLLLGVGFLLPWYEFQESFGAPTAPGAPSNATADPEQQYYYPFRMSGDLSRQDMEGGEARVRILGWIAAAAIAILGATLVLELGLGTIELGRWPLMVLAVLGFGATAAALWWTYFHLPGALVHEGVTQTFTHVRDDGDVVRTTVGWGFIAAALSLASTLSFVAFKFATGLQDPAAVEEFLREDEA